MKLVLLLLLTLTLSVNAAFVPQDDGIYAQFGVTHDGTDYEFTAKLHYQEVPMTVLNFIELAEGTKNWADFAAFTEKSAPFYDGLTFHRVVSGFVIQAGSRNGSGTDGPGFQFPDDIDGNLSHSGPGILSMANSGDNTNGSQFFITLAAATHLDGKHSIFGVIVDGLSDVTTLGGVAVDGSSKPTSDMVINSVSVIRVGTDAINFSSTGQIRPQVRGLVRTEFITAAGPTYTIRIPNRNTTYSYHLYGTPDLKNNWAPGFIAAPDFSASGDLNLNATSLVNTNDRYFFSTAEAEIGSRTDGTGLNYTFSLGTLSDMEVNLASATSGTFSYDGSSGPLSFYQLFDLGDRYQLYFQMTNGTPFNFVFQVYFEKNASSGGVFAHRVDLSTGSAIESNLTGSFTSP
ncbi:MAG: peptidylprolyl isomerase [Verrucomicrobiota bacterium]